MPPLGRFRLSASDCFPHQVRPLAKRLGITTDAHKVIMSLMRCLAADLAASLGVDVSRIKVQHKADPAAPPKEEAEGLGLFYLSEVGACDMCIFFRHQDGDETPVDEVRERCDERYDARYVERCDERYVERCDEHLLDDSSDDLPHPLVCRCSPLSSCSRSSRRGSLPVRFICHRRTTRSALPLMEVRSGAAISSSRSGVRTRRSPS